MKSVRNLHLLKTSLFISILLLLPSCSEWYVRDKQYIDLSADEERWFVAEEYKDKLVLGDRLGNIETFSFENEWQGWNMHGSSSGLEREETYFENKNQSFISSRGTDYNIQMNPEEPPQGTMLSVEVKDLRFRYDLHHKRLFGVSSLHGNKHVWIWYEGINSEDTIYSKAIYLDSISIKGQLFYDLLKFTFLDFEDKWEASTPTEFIIAKDLGLVSYTLNDGTLMERK